MGTTSGKRREIVLKGQGVLAAEGGKFTPAMTAKGKIQKKKTKQQSRKKPILKLFQDPTPALALQAVPQSDKTSTQQNDKTSAVPQGRVKTAKGRQNVTYHFLFVSSTGLPCLTRANRRAEVAQFNNVVKVGAFHQNPAAAILAHLKNTI